jgi:hypothetical protein
MQIKNALAREINRVSERRRVAKFLTCASSSQKSWVGMGWPVAKVVKTSGVAPCVSKLLTTFAPQVLTMEEE